ncbi:protein-glutamate O-methyltransferase CheR [Acidocella sp.]|uniref:CheR family methyltransferase n=1 Tax=Acidocella sp. TaxID=50710 RepID=UPI0026128CD3|nr:protein-glutamate O-methyltransferase CheR [Acidocella sp.]MDD2796149.1 protein-glutamate O-methyltransferase CheR [Acidocella sp.]
MNAPSNSIKLSSGTTETSEFLMTQRDFTAISGMLMAEAGISLSDNKANLVYSRLAKRLRLLGLGNFSEYCRLVESPAGAGERQNMVAALTTNVTRFYREPHHFEHLKTEILPELVHRVKQGYAARLWSAACSSGQEPYSIALTLLSLLPDAVKYDIRILATDIDANMLVMGATGIYETSLLDAVPNALRRRWFSPPREGRQQIADEARALVKFRRLNLIGNWPMRGTFDVVFCRNVVIYFENDTQEKIWSRITPLLTPGGALYIGHSERVSGPAEAGLRSDGITIYRPRTARREQP